MYDNVSSVNERNGESWRLLVEERFATIEKLRTLFLERFDVFFVFYSFCVFYWSLRTSLLCIVGELVL